MIGVTRICLSFSSSTLLDSSANAFSGSINFVHKERKRVGERELFTYIHIYIEYRISNASEVRSVMSEIDSTTKYGARLFAYDTHVRSMLSRMECENTATATCH